MKRKCDKYIHNFFYRWVTSPRGREKSEYEREKQKFLEEQRLAKQQKKIQREQEEKEV